MRNANWLIAAGLIVATTTACVETGYPTPSYGSNPSYVQSGSGYAYGGQPGYYGQQGSYQQPTSRYYTPVAQTRYVAVPVATRAPQPRGMGDRDHDGIPNRYDADRNGDGVRDRR